MKESIKSKKSRGGQIGNNNAEKWTEDEAIKLGEEMIAWFLPKWIKDPTNENKKIDIHQRNFLYEDFLHIQKGLYPQIIKYLSEKFNSFLHLIKVAKKLQETKLNKYAVMGALSTAYVCFFQKNHHGYRDRTQIDHTGNVGNVPTLDYSKLTDKELRTMEKIIEKTRDRTES